MRDRRAKRGGHVHPEGLPDLTPSYFEQRDSSAFLDGAILAANDTITVSVVSGSAIVYGATVDNRTYDPSLQIARRVP